MTPLGVGAAYCREALERYRGSIAELAGLLEAPRMNGPAGATLVAFDELVHGLAVDSLARRGPQGSARMSPAEARLFAPALSDAYDRLERLARQRPSRSWLPTLEEIDHRLAAAEEGLERWSRQVDADRTG